MRISFVNDVSVLKDIFHTFLVFFWPLLNYARAIQNIKNCYLVAAVLSVSDVGILSMKITLQ